MIYRAIGGSGAAQGTVEYLSGDLTITCTETGEEWTMSRGRLEMVLYQRPGILDPAEGLPNPSTGTLTGFPEAKSKEWDQVIDRINSEKRAVMEKNSS